MIASFSGYCTGMNRSSPHGLSVKQILYTVKVYTVSINLFILTLFEVVNNNCIVATIRDNSFTVRPEAPKPHFVSNKLE